MQQFLPGFSTWRVCVLLTAAFMSQPVTAQGTRADYERASQLLDMTALTSRTSLSPRWIGGGDRFWYLDRHEGRKTFVLVDPAAERQAQAFDHGRLAAALSAVSDTPYRAEALPFDEAIFLDDGRRITFSVGEQGWACDLAAYTCASTAVRYRTGDLLSPNERWALFVKDDNLWVRDTSTGEENALTSDGEALNSYGSADIGQFVSRELMQSPRGLRYVFSKDSRRIIGLKIDTRRVEKLTVPETVMSGRERYHSYPFAFAGDAELPQGKLVIFDLERKAAIPVDYPAFDQYALYEAAFCWNAAATNACFMQNARGYGSATINIIDTASGKLRPAFVEQLAPYIDRGADARFAGNDLVWISERDGWKHLYRVDLHTGKIRNRITRGAWMVRELLHVDEAAGFVYFTAGGREAGENPYHRILYRARLDGSRLERLTPEAGDHTIAFAPSGRYFVDTFESLAAPPVSNLRTADGRLIRQLQQANVSRLLATGWKPPEPFTVKAADGKTDIYGAIYRPTNFDPSRRYPVIDQIYPGPQTIRTRQTFISTRPSRDEDAMAELGFIVVTVDGRGTTFRSRAFREYSAGRLGTAGGLEDHVAALRQLAARYPQFDLDRVGITGHSGGGYATVRALLDYPEFYKVGVASAANHDMRSYSAGWGERYQGYPVGDNYLEQANTLRADRLQGKLLIVHGEMDDNVHPDHLRQITNAFIAANRDFDMLILPNHNHSMVDVTRGKAAGTFPSPYFMRRRWDYFTEHLLGVTPPADFRIEPKASDRDAAGR